MTETRTPVVFRDGRLPNDPSKPRLRLTPHLRTTEVPAKVDYYSAVSNWGMLGNDQWGDCTCAGDGHVIEQQTALGQNKEQVVSTSQALAAYTAISGFDPNAGPPGFNPTDNGATVQDALGYIRDTGMAGHKIAMFAELNVSDHKEIMQAAYEFGCLSLGVNLPDSAMQQFNQGQPWTVVPGSQIDGGHCVIAVGYDAEYVYVATWGTIQRLTWAWWDAYVEEAWAIVSHDWVNKASGNDPAGVNLSTLGEEFSSLTGQPNPFGPNPGPTPEPPAPQHFSIWDYIRAIWDAIWETI